MKKVERIGNFLFRFFVVVGVILIAEQICFSIFHESDPDLEESYSTGSSSNSHYNTYHSSYSGSSSYMRKAAPTTSPVKKNTGSSKKSSSKKSKYSMSTYRDPDDYCDVEGFYYDNRDEFESEDDAWDYLDDEWDDDEWNQ